MDIVRPLYLLRDCTEVMVFILVLINYRLQAKDMHIRKIGGSKMCVRAVAMVKGVFSFLHNKYLHFCYLCSPDQ